MSVERILNFALKRTHLTIFGLELEKTIFPLDFRTFNLSKCNISCKQNIFKCRMNLGIFGLEFEKATVVWYFT